MESDDAPPSPNWIYVRGRDGGIRKVEVSHASIAYDESEAKGRSGASRSDLVAGTEVRITAEQGSDGEWRAKSVEIVNRDTSKQSHGAGKT